MGIGHEQLAGVVRAEDAAEGTGHLRGERRTGGRRQQAVRSDEECVDERRAGVWADAHSDEIAAIAVEEDIPGVRDVRQRECRAGDRLQPAATVHGEAGVVAAACTRVCDVDEVSVHSDRYRLQPAARNRAALHRTERAIVRDAFY